MDVLLAKAHDDCLSDDMLVFVDSSTSEAYRQAFVWIPKSDAPVVIKLSEIRFDPEKYKIRIWSTGLNEQSLRPCSNQDFVPKTGVNASLSECERDYVFVDGCLSYSGSAANDGHWIYVEWS